MEDNIMSEVRDIIADYQHKVTENIMRQTQIQEEAIDKMVDLGLDYDVAAEIFMEATVYAITSNLPATKDDYKKSINLLMMAAPED